MVAVFVVLNTAGGRGWKFWAMLAKVKLYC